MQVPASKLSGGECSPRPDDEELFLLKVRQEGLTRETNYWSKMKGVDREGKSDGEKKNMSQKERQCRQSHPWH